MLRTLVMIFHVLLAVGLVALILLQRGKGAEVGTAFGAGASGTVFGARGSASFLTRATAVLATLFFVTSLSLAFLSSRPTTAPKSILDTATQEQPAGELPPPAPGAASSTPAPESAAPASEETSQQPPAASPDADGTQPEEGEEDGETPQQ